MCYSDTAFYEKLQKLYENKCGQAEQAKSTPNSLRYQVLKAEADAIKAEIVLSGPV